MTTQNADKGNLISRSVEGFNRKAYRFSGELRELQCGHISLRLRRRVISGKKQIYATLMFTERSITRGFAADLVLRLGDKQHAVFNTRGEAILPDQGEEDVPVQLHYQRS